MRRIGVNLEDKAKAEVVDKARAKRSRRDATRRSKEPPTPAVPDGATGGVTETIKDIAQDAFAKVEELVATASEKIKGMVEGSPPEAADTKHKRLDLRWTVDWSCRILSSP